MKRCGLCGRAGKLTATECCGHAVCDDLAYEMERSGKRTWCWRNHERYTLCGYHYNEGHEGDWQTCAACRESFMPELYVWYGTNEHNFEQLRNPPHFEPTLCASCARRIDLGRDGYTIVPDGNIFCTSCR